MKEQSKIEHAAIKASIDRFGYEESDYTIPFVHGANWAIELCDKVIRKVLEHYEHGGVIDCIMADYDEIISIEKD